MMEPFTQYYTVQAIHLDAKRQLRPSVLLHFVQEAAGGHCLQLGLDWESLAKKGLFWAVIRHRMQILRHPVAGETITVETWPMPTTRSAFPRATVGYDAEGKEVFRAISLWVLMDKESRAMVLPGKSGVVVEGIVVVPLQRGTDVLLGDGVATGGVDIVDALGLQPVHQTLGAFCVNFLNRNAAEAQTGNLQAGLAQYTIFHVCYLRNFYFIPVYSIIPEKTR